MIAAQNIVLLQFEILNKHHLQLDINIKYQYHLKSDEVLLCFNITTSRSLSQRFHGISHRIPDIIESAKKQKFPAWPIFVFWT